MRSLLCNVIAFPLHNVIAFPLFDTFTLTLYARMPYESLVMYRDADENSGSAWCVTLSFFTQLAFFAGECWLLVISMDLVVSLSNPFSSIHGNLNKYKVINCQYL